MKWRAATSLFTGLLFMYITTLLKEPPPLQPRTIHFASHSNNFEYIPDRVIVNIIGSFIYVTSIKLQASKSQGSLIGTGNVKIGVQGIIQQIRRPISDLLDQGKVPESNGWFTCFKHELKGAISFVSERNGVNDFPSHQFAVLYHYTEDFQIFHVVRIYYISKSAEFKFKDILLPGTIWINAISLENDSLLYLRYPDQYEFHIMKLPLDLVYTPHSEFVTNLTNYSIERGRLIEDWYQPRSTQEHLNLISKLYSPVNETFRVLTLNMDRTEFKIHVNITLVDRVVSVKDGQMHAAWFQREKGESKYSVHGSESFDYDPFNLYKNQPPKIQPKIVPELQMSTSYDSATIVFPYNSNKFITLDYTDQIESLNQIEEEKERLYSNDGGKTVVPEYYYWKMYETAQSDIKGVKLSPDGRSLAIWTDRQFISLYNRDRESKFRGRCVWLNRVCTVLEGVFLSNSDKKRAAHRDSLPASWKINATIIPTKDANGYPKRIGSVGFWTDKKGGGKYIFVAFEDGNVKSYRINQAEILNNVSTFSRLLEQWEMFAIMSLVILLFVYYESQQLY